MTANREAAAAGQLRRNRWIFSSLLALYCGWVLSFPVFPTQDGPAHRFYAGVLAQELFQPHYSQAYRLRLPVPPYAAEDYALALLSRVMDIVLAEKLFLCLTMVAMAFGIRACCRRMGAGGLWISLFAMPLLLHWSLGLGFLNYALGLGWMLLAFSSWLAAENGSARPWIYFGIWVGLLIFTHPVPLLMLAALCFFDLLTSALLWGRPLRVRSRRLAPKAVALAFTVCALAYPLLYADAQRSSRDMRGSALQWHTYVNELLLEGLSPFYRHAPIFSTITLYRAMIWAILGGAVLLGSRGFRQRWRQRELSRPDCMLLGALALFFVIPLMPDKLNGALDFFIRMLVIVWVLALFAASQASLPRRLGPAVGCAAIFCALTALLPAELYFRPAARRLAAVEYLRLPRRGHGLILEVEKKVVDLDGSRPGMTAEPYLWSSMAPALRAHAVVINSPWIDASYLPLKPGSDPRMLINIVQSRSEQEEIDRHDGDLSHILPGERDDALRAADYVFLVGAGLGPDDIKKQVGAQSRGLRCSFEAWYALCLR